jgi:hypothetical protein
MMISLGLNFNHAQVRARHSVTPSVSISCRCYVNDTNPIGRPRKDSLVPLSRPVLGIDGQTIDRIHVQAGTMVVVGAAAVNRDPVIWGPEADQWIPERWLKPLPETVLDAYLPGVYSHMFVLQDIASA